MVAEQTCGACGKPFPVNEENIIIGKNGHHISVMCPACSSPRTLSYDFLAKVRGTDVAGAREWVRTQFAAGRKNPASKSKKTDKTESGQPIVVQEEATIVDDTDKPIEFVDPIPGAGTEEPFVKTVILTPKADRKLEVKQMETDPVAATISVRP